MSLRPVFLLVLTLSLLLSSLVSGSASPEADPEISFTALDAAVSAQMSKHGLPGAALAVVRGNEIIYTKGYGVEGGRPMTPQTQMFIGSQSKSFTALLIVMLAEQGLLDLNAPVQTYVPWFKVSDEAASSRITVNHLLHHTSGLSESGFSVLLPDDASLEQAVRALEAARLTAEPGARFQYFNLGYTVLSYLVEVVTGESYAEYLKAMVLDPLGMSMTTADPETAADLAQGYTRFFGFAVPKGQRVRSYEIGAGYIVSTVEDMARYAAVMSGGGAGLIQPASTKRMFTPGMGGYGMGWMISRDGSKIFHGGANETFRTDVNLYPQRDLAFVLLVNQGYLIDHYVSAPQLASSVEAIVLSRTPPPLSQGLSARWYGWALGVLVLGLCVLQTRNFISLRTWRERLYQMPAAKKAWEVGLSFIIPTVILIVVFTQMKAFFDYRFNLLTTLANFPGTLPDVVVLMLVGSVPDYLQGMIKLIGWVGASQNKNKSTRTVSDPAV
jgi:CubicO group peptidase (beta-lactamase class C family)